MSEKPSEEAVLTLWRFRYNDPFNEASEFDRQRLALLRKELRAIYAIDFQPPWPHGIGEHGPGEEADRQPPTDAEIQAAGLKHYSRVPGYPESRDKP